VEPGAFDGAATIALLLLLPAAALFVAAALRRLRVPRWSWSLYLLGTAGVLLLLHLAGSTRYEPDHAEVDPDPFWDFGQFVGLGFGRIGVAVNAIAATIWIVTRRRGYHERLTTRETRLLVAAYGVMAVATALPATWWAVGLGIVPLLVELPVALIGAACLTAALILRHRRHRGAADDDLPSVMTPWPADAAVAVWLTGALAVAPLFAGSGLPDWSTVPDPDAAATPSPVAPPQGQAPEPEWAGPTPVTSTRLDPGAVVTGTRAMLVDTVRWAGPLDDLSSPTPAPAAPPTVVLTEASCDGGGRRWIGSLVLPTVRPQDLAPRVQAGWDAAGYAVIDHAMGTDLVMPVRDDAAVERMLLTGRTDGVHVDVESFCVDD